MSPDREFLQLEAASTLSMFSWLREHGRSVFTLVAFARHRPVHAEDRRLPASVPMMAAPCADMTSGTRAQALPSAGWRSSLTVTEHYAHMAESVLEAAASETEVVPR